MKMIMFLWLIFQDPPIFTEWETVATIHYEIKNSLEICKRSEIAVSYVGFYRIYKNNKNQEEFALVISKYPAQTIIPKCSSGADEESIDFAQNYAKQKKIEELNNFTENSDIIAIAKWSQKKDERTGENILNSRIESWLNLPSGWIYELNNSPSISVESISEPDIYGKNKMVLIGFKISLGGKYQIIKFDQQQLEQSGNGDGQ